ncbi:acyltransferase [Nitrosomonas sp. wSCUT-2]
MIIKTFRFIERKILLIYSFLIFKKRVNCHGFFKVLRPENIKIGYDCHINYGVFILGHNRVQIGNRVVLSVRAMIIDSGLDLDSIQREHIYDHVIIQDDAWIGAGAIILPGVTVGKGAIIGAGSVVTKSVPSYCLVAGNPARVIRELKPTASKCP